MNRASQFEQEMLVEQLLWLIQLRWIAAAGVVTAAVVGNYVFPVLISPVPIYVCAGAILLCNVFYYLAITGKGSGARAKSVVLGMVQVEADIVILTAVLHFSGGVINPFFLFYLFHVIIATIILPRNLSYSVGLTTILLFGLLAVNELNGGGLLGYYPLKFSVAGGLWRDPTFLLGIFIAFAFTVVLAQYLTRKIIVRMTARHRSLQKDLRDRAEQIAAINETLKTTRVQMAHHEKMVAIGQMAAGIAHEIGNPLASLSSVVQYLCRKLSRHEEKEQLLLIEHQIDRISSILKRMLSLSRPIIREYKWSDINELVDNTLSLIKFDKRIQAITVKNINSSDLPMVWLNPQLFEQVLLNIFINSIDAMELKQGEHEHILEITRESKDAMVEIRVCDTGIGMNQQVAKRAFESFFTTKEIGKGTGLGLFICYNLVSEIDGTIKLESEPSKGTTVIIRIPVRPQKNLITSGDGQMDFVI